AKIAEIGLHLGAAAADLEHLFHRWADDAVLGRVDEAKNDRQVLDVLEGPMKALERPGLVERQALDQRRHAGEVDLALEVPLRREAPELPEVPELPVLDRLDVAVREPPLPPPHRLERALEPGVVGTPPVSRLDRLVEEAQASQQ